VPTLGRGEALSEEGEEEAVVRVHPAPAPVLPASIHAAHSVHGGGLLLQLFEGMIGLHFSGLATFFFCSFFPMMTLAWWMYTNLTPPGSECQPYYKVEGGGYGALDPAQAVWRERLKAFYGENNPGRVGTFHFHVTFSPK
jgi:hypothetical protein